MSGAYEQPVLRAQPTMRPAVQRNTSAYMRDPRAGQRNMQLEVQAVAAQAKPFLAMSEGLKQIAETFAKVDAEEELTSANLDLRTKTESMLANMKAMPIARQESTLNGHTGSIDTTYAPVHKTSYKAFSAALLHERDRLAKTLPRNVRAAFLKGSVNYIAQAQAEAQSTNRKQHITYLKGKTYEHLKSATTLSQIDSIASNNATVLSWDPIELAKLVESRKRELAVDHYGYRVQKIANYSSDAPTQLNEIRRELRNNGMEAETAPTADGDPAQVKNQYFDHLKNEDRSKILEAIQSKINQIEKNAKTNRENWVNDTLADVLANPQKYNEGRFQEMLADRKIIASDHATLTNAWTAAINGPLSSMPGAQIKYNLSIGDDLHTIENIANDAELTVSDRLKYIAKRRAWEKGVRAWDDENNPVSNLGYLAVKKLERHFGYLPGGYISTRAKNQAESDNEAAFIEVYDRLELLMMSDQFTDAQKPEAAWEWVDTELQKLKTAASQDATNNPYNLTPVKLGQLRTFEEKNGEVDSIFAKPNGKEKQELLRELQRMGLKPTPEQLGGKTFKELIEESGPEAAWHNLWNLLD